MSKTFTLIKLEDTEWKWDNFVLIEGEKRTLLWYDKVSGECSLIYDEDDAYDDINEFTFANEAQVMIKALYEKKSNMCEVVLTTVDDVIFTGSKEACDNVMEAFFSYNNAKNIEMRDKS